MKVRRESSPCSRLRYFPGVPPRSSATVRPPAITSTSGMWLMPSLGAWKLVPGMVAASISVRVVKLPSPSCTPSSLRSLAPARNQLLLRRGWARCRPAQLTPRRLPKAWLEASHAFGLGSGTNRRMASGLALVKGTAKPPIHPPQTLSHNFSGLLPKNIPAGYGTNAATHLTHSYGRLRCRKGRGGRATEVGGRAGSDDHRCDGVVGAERRTEDGRRPDFRVAPRRRRCRAFIVQKVARQQIVEVDQGLPVRYGADRPGRFRFQWPWALGRLIRETRRADLVLSGADVGNGLLLGWVAARLTRRPYVVFVQSDLDDAIRTWVSRPLRPLTRWVHAHADAVICVADSIVPGVVRNGMAREAIWVVPNGVDVDRLRAMAELPAFDLSSPMVHSNGQPATLDQVEGPSETSHPNGPVVVANGRLSSVKGFDVLVRAHALVRSRGVAHRLRIMGEGPQRGRLEELVRELDVADTVELAGHVANPYPSIARADLFVLSSRLEGMPLTLLEALALGAPVVASECSSGVTELLGSSRFGDLVPVGSVEDLAAAIERHLRSPNRLADKAQYASKHARSYDIESSARRHLEILGKVSR